jgi:hypothetical protein
LRTEIGRLRAAIRTLAGVSATAQGFALMPRRAREIVVQRALDSLAAAGKVQPLGRGRAGRWLTPPVPGFATTLLLPGSLPND